MKRALSLSLSLSIRVVCAWQDDMQLVRDNLGIEDEPVTKRARMAADSLKATDASELEQRLFDDDDDSDDGGRKSKKPAAKSRPTAAEGGDDYFDEDNFDDFIEDDLGEQDQLLASERQQRPESKVSVFLKAYVVRRGFISREKKSRVVSGGVLGRKENDLSLSLEILSFSLPGKRKRERRGRGSAKGFFLF